MREGDRPEGPGAGGPETAGATRGVPGGPAGVPASLPALALAGLVLLAWEGAVRIGNVTPLVLPPPSAILSAMATGAPAYLPHALTTGAEVAAGLLLATAVGSVLGTVIATRPLLGRALYPLVVSAQVVPKVAVAPLLVMWLGFDLAPKLVLTALIAFFPVVTNTVAGLGLTRPVALHLFRSLGASPAQTFWKLRLPAALPVFFAGLRVAATLALIGAVVGEFAGGSAGLGHLLLLQAGRLDTAAAFGSVGYLTLLGLAAVLLVSAVERLVVPPHLLGRVEDLAAGG